MVQMNFIFIFISSSDPNLLGKKSVKQKINNDGLRHIRLNFRSLNYKSELNCSVTIKERGLDHRLILDNSSSKEFGI